MNRYGVIKQVRKADSRMSFEVDMQNILSGYLSPELHKSLRQLTSAKKRKPLS